MVLAVRLLRVAATGTATAPEPGDGEQGSECVNVDSSLVRYSNLHAVTGSSSGFTVPLNVAAVLPTFEAAASMTSASSNERAVDVDALAVGEVDVAPGRAGRFLHRYPLPVP